MINLWLCTENRAGDDLFDHYRHMLGSGPNRVRSFVMVSALNSY